MNKFGFKVVDERAAALGPVLDYAVDRGLPVEVGLYFSDRDALALLERRLADTGVPVNAHSDHGRYHAFNFDRTRGLLEEHIRLARQLGSAYSIVHTGASPMTQRPSRQSALFRLLVDNLARAEDLCTALDYRLHLENVYHPLAFYRELFAAIQRQGLRRIHFCFDIGHAKIWSSESLDDWLNFLDELVREGFALHFHLHANRGFADEHLALAEAQALAIAEPDDYYNPYGYPGAFRKVGERFPDAVKIFEVKLEQAIPNLEATINPSS
ncbi:sugar phosphate isomerase/epimerase family protein [Candidatus Methylocalor cossyra]|uniref:Xylose isomerase-like TIM barrel domain-containing protein n=1 Tax=Candidatus Methylocalor cossyra TaxID=3108543 RepID=A0ABP1C4B3_9GAMM